MHHSIQSRRSGRGFSLVELIIAIGLSATLMFGVLQIFDANKQSTRMQHAMVEVQEGGRIATELLARDIRRADYWGCMDLVSDVNNILDLDANNSDHDEYFFQNSTPVNGDNNVAAGVTFGSGDSEVAVDAGTDILKLKTATSMSNVRVSHEMNSNAAVLKIFNIDGINIPDGTVLMVTDCSMADIFASTQPTEGDGGNSELQISHNGGANAGADWSNTTQRFSKAYGSDAQLLMPVTNIYFVGRKAGASVSSLYVQKNGGAPDELVRHVDDLQFTFGVDTDDDGVVNLLIEAPNTAQLDKAMSIRVNISTHSRKDVVDGAPLSRNFTSTTNIRNRSI